MLRACSVRSSSLVVALLAALAGCSGSSISVAVTPPHGPVLTCSTQMMSAVVTGSTDEVVAWSVMGDSSHGAIDMTSGLYTAPLSMPTPSTATVVATAHADGKTTGTSLLTLGTAFPSAARPVTGSAGYSSFDTGIFAHAVAAKGMRVYAAWPDDVTGAAKVGLKVARSDDGGSTWMAPVTALTLNTKAGKVVPDAFIRCPGLAIDAGNPDVVYAIGGASGPVDPGIPDDSLDSDSTQLIGISTDGGVTWTQHLLSVGPAQICADVASPAANTVVVVRARLGLQRPERGARHLPLVGRQPGRRVRDGRGHREPGLEVLRRWLHARPRRSEQRPGVHGGAPVDVASNGGTDSAGDATESPRLFTDGAGNLCASYIGFINHADSTVDTNVYVQCSSDAGKTWTAPVNVDGADAPKVSTSAVGAMGPNGAVAVIWADGKNGGLYTAFSTDGGKTFAPRVQAPHPIQFEGDTERSIAVNPTVAYDAAGILWAGYRAYDGSIDQLMVDKSCDGGQTWSGVREIDTPAAALRYPTFALTPGAAPTLAAWATDHVATYTLIPQ